MRVAVIEKWVAVADICRCLHNYNAILEITSSLNRSSIFRLKKTWLKVSKQVPGNVQPSHRGGRFQIFIRSFFGASSIKVRQSSISKLHTHLLMDLLKEEFVIRTSDGRHFATNQHAGQRAWMLLLLFRSHHISSSQSPSMRCALAASGHWNVYWNQMFHLPCTRLLTRDWPRSHL